MELGAADPITGDKKPFFFYPLLAISRQNLTGLYHNFKHGREKNLRNITWLWHTLATLLEYGTVIKF